MTVGAWILVGLAICLLIAGAATALSSRVESAEPIEEE